MSLKLEHGASYRARNGDIYTLEPMPTSYYVDRPFMDSHCFCANKGLISWKPDGTYSAVSSLGKSSFDLVEKLPDDYKKSRVEQTKAEWDAAIYEQEQADLDEYVVVKLSKKELLFITTVLGNTDCQSALLKSRSTYSGVAVNHPLWRGYVKSLTHDFPVTVFSRLLKFLSSTK